MVLPNRVPEVVVEAVRIRVPEVVEAEVVEAVGANRSDAAAEVVEAGADNNRHHHNNDDDGDACHDLCRDRANIYP